MMHIVVLQAWTELLSIIKHLDLCFELFWGLCRCVDGNGSNIFSVLRLIRNRSLYRVSSSGPWKPLCRTDMSGAWLRFSYCLRMILPCARNNLRFIAVWCRSRLSVCLGFSALLQFTAERRSVLSCSCLMIETSLEITVRFKITYYTALWKLDSDWSPHCG